MRRKYIYQLSTEPEIHINAERVCDLFDVSDFGWASIQDCSLEEREEALDLLKGIFGNDDLQITTSVIKAPMVAFPALILDGVLFSEDSRNLSPVLEKEYKNVKLQFMNCLVYEEEN